MFQLYHVFRSDEESYFVPVGIYAAGSEQEALRLHKEKGLINRRGSYLAMSEKELKDYKKGKEGRVV